MGEQDPYKTKVHIDGLLVRIIALYEIKTYILACCWVSFEFLGLEHNLRLL